VPQKIYTLKGPDGKSFTVQGPDDATDDQIIAAGKSLYTPLMVEDAAKKYGIDPELAKGVARQESNFNQDAKSSRGAIGVMQLMPDTAKELGVDPNDVTQNIDGGVRYLKQHIDRFKDPKLALAAYNAGPTAVAKAGNQIPNIPETQDYVKSIMDKMPVSATAPTQATPAPPIKDPKLDFDWLVNQEQGNPPSDTGPMAALGRVASNVAGIPGKVYGAFANAPATPEEQAAETSSGRLGLASKRLFADPYTAPHGPLETAKEKAAKGEYLSAAVHALGGAIPGVGPYAEQLSQRWTGTGAFQGQPPDPWGALTETVAGAAVPAAVNKVLPAIAHPLDTASDLMRKAVGAPPEQPMLSPTPAGRIGNAIAPNMPVEDVEASIDEAKAAAAARGNMVTNLPEAQQAVKQVVTDTQTKLDKNVWDQYGSAALDRAQTVAQFKADALAKLPKDILVGSREYREVSAKINDRLAQTIPSHPTVKDLDNLRSGLGSENSAYHASQKVGAVLQKDQILNNAVNVAMEDTSRRMLHDWLEVNAGPQVRDYVATQHGILGRTMDFESALNQHEIEAGQQTQQPLVPQLVKRFGTSVGSLVSKNITPFTPIDRNIELAFRGSSGQPASAAATTAGAATQPWQMPPVVRFPPGAPSAPPAPGAVAPGPPGGSLYTGTQPPQTPLTHQTTAGLANRYRGRVTPPRPGQLGDR